MLIGQSFLSDNETYTYFSPWFARDGDEAVFLIEVMKLKSGVTLDVTVQHKNADDTTEGTLTTFSQINSTTQTTDPKTYSTSTVSGIKELLRFKFDVADGGTRGWIHSRVLTPLWVTNGA